MTPEEQVQFDEMYQFIQNLQASGTFPHEVDAAMRERFNFLSGLIASDINSNAPLAAITAPTGGATIDTQARTAINTIITALETLGLVAEN